MAVIGNITASGSSAIFNLDYLPERLLLNEIKSGSNASFSNFSVVTSGVQLMSLTSSDRFTAVAKFDNQIALGGSPAVAPYIRLATGRINKQSTIQATDGTPGGVTYPYPVQAASTNICSMARRAVESSINPSANATFNNFEALFIEPANFLRAQLTFDNGFTDEYTPAECEALFVAYNQADILATLGGLTCIAGETPFGNIAQAVIYTTSGGSCVVVKTDYVQL